MPSACDHSWIRSVPSELWLSERATLVLKRPMRCGADGLAVTVVERGPFVLHREDAALTKIVRERLERFRVELRTQTTVASIESGPCRGRSLRSGDPGGRPASECRDRRTRRASSSGAPEPSKSTSVCRRISAVSLPRATARRRCTWSPAGPTYIPLGTTANKMGRVAGANAAGRAERFAGIVGTAIVGVFGLGVATTGLSLEQARREGFSPVSARVTAPSRATLLPRESHSLWNWSRRRAIAGYWAGLCAGKTVWRAAST